MHTRTPDVRRRPKRYDDSDHNPTPEPSSPTENSTREKIGRVPRKSTPQEHLKSSSPLKRVPRRRNITHRGPIKKPQYLPLTPTSKKRQYTTFLNALGVKIPNTRQTCFQCLQMPPLLAQELDDVLRPLTATAWHLALGQISEARVSGPMTMDQTTQSI